jgi:hypothetical protein
MNFSLVKIKKAIEKFKAGINQEIISSLAAVIIFLYIFYSAFFGFELNESEISEYMKPFKDNCCEYDDSVNNAGASIRNLVEDSQVEELNYYDELINERSYNKREDPFTKSF